MWMDFPILWVYFKVKASPLYVIITAHYKTFKAKHYPKKNRENEIEFLSVCRVYYVKGLTKTARAMRVLPKNHKRAERVSLLLQLQHLTKAARYSQPPAYDWIVIKANSEESRDQKLPEKFYRTLQAALILSIFLCRRWGWFHALGDVPVQYLQSVLNIVAPCGMKKSYLFVLNRGYVKQKKRGVVLQQACPYKHAWMLCWNRQNTGNQEKEEISRRA